MTDHEKVHPSCRTLKTFAGIGRLLFDLSRFLVKQDQPDKPDSLDRLILSWTCGHRLHTSRHDISLAC
jgi:hypothetical protein